MASITFDPAGIQLDKNAIADIQIGEGDRFLELEFARSKFILFDDVTL